MDVLEFDVLVIGSGGAGLRASIEAAKYRLGVVILDKSKIAKGGATVASGGELAAPFHQHDSKRRFREDITTAGDHLNEQNLVAVLANESVNIAKDLEEFGLSWLRNSSGTYELRRLAGHTCPRTLISPYGGAYFVKVLAEEAKRCGVKFMEEVIVTSLVSCKGSVVGAIALDIKNGDFVVLKATSTILATGGLGQIYELTSNPRGATGDGYVLAYDAGAELMDMEMVQFNPQGLVWPFSVAGLLQSEETRMAGARYYNVLGERFLSRYDPTKMEHATRDKLSQYVAREIKEGRGTKRGGIVLDPSPIPEEQIPFLQKTVGMGGRLRRFYHFGIDPFRDKQEIYPSCHYMMGGIRIDERAESSIKGLYACGEVSAGVHGANRMGSNSLADTQVFGKLAGMHAALHASQNEAPPIDMEDAEKECERVNDLLALGNKNGIKPVDIKSRIRQLMSEYVGVIRSGEGLRKAIAELDRISREDLSHAYIACKTRCYNNSWIELLETCNMVLVSKMIARSALNRTETRGAHYREDFPGRDDQKFLFHISVKKVNNEMRLSKLPITVSN